MKKTMILAAFAALVSLASCQKEDVIDNKGTDKKASPVFTASIAGATRTTVDLIDGKVAWEESDEITITDASLASAVYEIESIDETTGEATFVIKSSETALGDGPYTATYGTAPATAQTYSAIAGKLYMTAPETSDKSFTFTVQCGLMNLKLTKTDESVKSIAVTGTPTGGSETTYTLTCDPAQSIAITKDFCIALPEGSYTKIEITNADDITCTLNSAAGVSVATNHIKPVTFGGSKLNFAPAAPDPVAPTRGTATAIITQEETDIDWIQLWPNGPKFANNMDDFCFVGSFSSPDAAYHNGVFEWGPDWRIPTHDELDEFYKAVTGDPDAKVSYTYGEVDGEWGFIFTGKEEGYTENSKFFSGSGDEEDMGQLRCWSSDGGYLTVTYLFGEIAYEDNLTCWTNESYVDISDVPCFIYAVLNE